MLDRKGHGITQAEGRVISAGLDDVVSLFEGDAGTYNSPFNLGVSLHSCGALSDVAQKVCLAAAAAYILCPCCYGQLAASGVQPRSEATASVPATSWDLIASTAEFSIQPQKQRGRHSKPSPGGQWDFGDTEDYLLASDDSSPIHFVYLQFNSRTLMAVHQSPLTKKLLVPKHQTISVLCTLGSVASYPIYAADVRALR